MKLTIILQGSLAFDGERYLGESLTGSYIEKLAPYFDQVKICAPIISENSKFFDSYRDHKFESKNISFCPLPVNKGENPGIFRTVFKLIRQGFVIFKEMKDWDLIYIFLPSYIAHLTFLGARIFHKPFFIYVASDLKEVCQSTYRWGNDIRRLLRPLYLAFNSMLYSLENIMAKRAVFVLVHGESLYKRFNNKRVPVYRVAPRIKMSKMDLYNRVDTCEGEITKLLFVGSLIERKGIIYLIDAISQIRDEGFRAHLSIVGVGNQDNKLKEHAEKMGISDSISFLGYISNGPELYKIYRESDIFVLPTLSEGFPRVLYESMGQGIPIVTTNVSGIEALMKDEVNALIVPPKSAEAIVKSIKRIIEDGKLRRRLIRGGLKTIIPILELDPGRQIEQLLKTHFFAYKNQQKVDGFIKET